MAPKNTKYIVITGGVLSGLGKGIATASVGHLLSSKLKVIPIKCDGYLNTDPGTMNPIEHGEVFVLDDGGEVDMDFGHYERFLGVTCRSEWNLTMGKVYWRILERERRGDYLGKTVQLIPHVTDEIKSHFKKIAQQEKADIVLIEIGGTVGDMENELFIEAVRQLGQEVGEDNIVYIHLTYVPIPPNLGEHKTKPTQQSVKLLNERGIRPDIIIARSPKPLTQKVKEKIALFCNIPPEAVISGPDVKTVYQVPILYDQQNLTALIHKKLKIYSPPNLAKWQKLVDAILNPEREVTIAICGKYTDLHDSYASILEALTHAGAHLKTKVRVKWIETTKIEQGKITVEKALADVQGVIVPGGFGLRGIEGKIDVIQYCRENKIPFLGICYGMQLAVIEFARNVCGLEGAHTTEAEEEGIEVKHPVICLLPSQKGLKKKGGTMRLGGQDVYIKPGTVAHKIYGADKVRERFRHRYEVNPEYVPTLEKCGLVFSGYEPQENIMQIMELPEHPFFIGVQYHPELISKLEKPEPLFYHLVKHALERV
ncbi:MAG TPA: CTP synthase (glutamine hydrolyzing) [candidate division Zixibacteria bacterium]|nr:CTP synthase (glutamine hydrolyzing) [candidate division Zixibacteria bacterium]